MESGTTIPLGWGTCTTITPYGSGALCVEWQNTVDAEAINFFMYEGFSQAITIGFLLTIMTITIVITIIPGIIITKLLWPKRKDHTHNFKSREIR